MDFELQGKRAIVTGASRGIGLAVAQRFADEGGAVAICARDAEHLDAMAKALEGRGAAQVFSRAVDVRDLEALRGFARDAIAALGGLDVLVSNPTGGGGPDEAGWRLTFEVDVLAAVAAVEETRAALASSGGGSIVFLSTIAALETFSGPVPYGPLKASLIVYAKELARALAPEGIRVNTVAPGPVFVEGGAWDRIKQRRPDRYEEVLAMSPRGSFGTPEEIANVVAFLASSASSFVSGTNIVADGAFSKRVDF